MNDTFENVDNMLLYEYDIEMKNSLEAIVTITVSLKMPTNEFEHAMIQGSTVSFQLHFNQEPAL